MTNDAIKNILAKIPADLEYLKQDLKDHITVLVENTARQTKLVTTKEFEVQTKVLAKANAKIAELEKQIAALESKIK